jgi:HEAT repeat protein
MPLIRRPQGDTPAAGADAERLLAELRSPGADERWRAARGLGAFAQAATVLGAAAASETDLRVREAMFTSLARIGTADALTALIAHVRSDDSGRRTGAMDALKSTPLGLEGVLADLLQDDDADVRVLACDLARELPSDQATTLLSAVLDRDLELNVCAAAVDVIADVGSPAAVEPLRRCAARFADQPFLDFAVRVACDRIGAQAPPRG